MVGLPVEAAFGPTVAARHGSALTCARGAGVRPLSFRMSKRGKAVISIDECNDLIEAMQTVVQMEDDFHEVCRRLPSIDELNELINAMRTVIMLNDELSGPRR